MKEDEIPGGILKLTCIVPGRALTDEQKTALQGIQQGAKELISAAAKIILNRQLYTTTCILITPLLVNL